MQQYNILQAIPMSFYSKKLYRDVAQNWGIQSFFYLLLIIALSWVVATVTMQRELNKLASAATEDLFSQIPVITVKDGTVSTPEKRPYIIKSPDKKETLVVIDTSGDAKLLNNIKEGVLITDKQIIIKNEGKKNATAKETTSIETYQIPSKINKTFDPQKYKHFLNASFNFLWIFYFIALVAASFTYRILQALLYSVIGKIFSLMTGVTLMYSQIFQISLIAITPVIFLSTLFYHFNVHFPLQFLFYFVLSMVYLFYGILANKTP